MAETPPERFEDPAGGFFAAQTQRRSGLEAVIIVAVIGALLGGVFLALDPMADAVARRLPLEIDRQVGSVAAAAVRAQYTVGSTRPSTAAAARVERVFAEVLALVPAQDRVAVATATITVLADDTANAFALPGGAVFVLTGLLDKDGIDDDTLRGVLAHELGHVVRRHSMRQLVRGQVLGLALAFFFGSFENLEQLVVGEAATLGSRAFSRADESEADDFALGLARAGGFGVEGMARFFEAEGSLGALAFWSTHPDGPARAAQLRSAWAKRGG